MPALGRRETPEIAHRTTVSIKALVVEPSCHPQAAQCTPYREPDDKDAIVAEVVLQFGGPDEGRHGSCRCYSRSPLRHFLV